MNPSIIAATRAYAFHALLLALLLVPVFPATFLRGEMISPGEILFETPPWSAYTPESYEPVQNRLACDAINQFHMWYVLVEASLHDGEWPLWNPLQFGGLPLHANFQSAIFYPFRMWHRFLDPHVATTLFILQKIWLCGMTAFIFGRGIGLATDASRMISVGWMLSGYLMTWTYWPEPDIAAWLPIFVLGIEFALTSQFRRGSFTMLFASTLLLYAGHPESAFTQALLAGFYLLMRLAFMRPDARTLWKCVACAGGVWLVTLPVSAVQVLPFAEYLPHSYTFIHRPELDPGADSIAPLSALALLVPRFLGLNALDNYWGFKNSNFTTMVYPGVAVWVGMALLTVSAKRPDPFRKYYVPLALAGFLALLLSFDVPALNFLKHLPVVGSLWYFWFIGFAVLAFPALAALGFVRWVSAPRDLRELRWVVIGFVTLYALIGLAYIALIGDAVDKSYTLTQILISVASALAGLTIAALHCFHVRRSVVFGLATAVLATDLLYAASALHPTVARRDLYVDTALTDYLRDLPHPSRVSAKSATFPDELGTGILQGYGIEQLWGYDGIFPARMIEFLGLAASPNWLRIEPMLAIDHYLFDAGAVNDEMLGDRFELSVTLDGIAVCANRNAMPRAFLVGSVRALPDAQSVLDSLARSDTDPFETVLTDDPPDGPLPNSRNRALGTATVTGRTNNRVDVQVDASESCVLVLSDAYFPGWQVNIDGASGEVFPAYHALRGVVVPAGSHEVRFTYEPWSFRVGLWVSVVSLLLSALVSVVMLVQRFKRLA